VMRHANPSSPGPLGGNDMTSTAQDPATLFPTPALLPARLLLPPRAR
jgi:hypothetical protein